MSYRMAISLTLLLSLYTDLPHLVSPRSSEITSPNSFAADDRIPLYPVTVTGQTQEPGSGKSSSSGGKRSATLQESSKLELIRYVSGEFAKARKPLPKGKDGFTLVADKPLDEEALNKAVNLHGAAVNTGDNAQITKLEFHEHSIVVDVNGGGRPKRNWREHLQIGFSGAPLPTSTTTTTQEQGPPGFQQGAGGTIYLQFAKGVPDLTPDELKNLLSSFLDFSNVRSASVNWIDTLPPK